MNNMLSTLKHGIEQVAKSGKEAIESLGKNSGEVALSTARIALFVGLILTGIGCTEDRSVTIVEGGDDEETPTEISGETPESKGGRIETNLCLVKTTFDLDHKSIEFENYNDQMVEVWVFDSNENGDENGVIADNWLDYNGYTGDKDIAYDAPLYEGQIVKERVEFFYPIDPNKICDEKSYTLKSQNGGTE